MCQKTRPLQIDDFNREGLCIDVDFSLPSERVIQSLDQVIEGEVPRLPSAVTTVLNISAPPQQSGRESVASELISYSRAIHNKMLMWKDTIARCVIIG